MSVREPFWTPWRLRAYPRVLLFGTLLGCIVSVLFAKGSQGPTGPLGGDFPAFYAAGTAVLRGGVDTLYDWETQRRLQAGLHGSSSGVFNAFSYPPFVALAYVPLAALPYRVAYLLHCIGMATALAGAIVLMGRMVPRIRTRWLEAFACAFLFYPMFRAVTGGQNTAVTTLCFVTVWAALNAKRPFAAGLAAGFALYKPQLALPLIGLIALTRQPGRVLGGAATSAALLFLGGMAVHGNGWVSWWWAGVAKFHATDQAVNAANSIGFLGFAEAVLGTGSTPALWIGGVLSVVTAVALAALWWRSDRMPLDLRMAAAATGTLLLSPHSMFYDAGLLVLPLAVLAQRHGRASLPWLTAVFVGAAGAAGSSVIGFNVLFFIVLGVAVATVRTIAGLPEYTRERVHPDM